MSSNTTKKTSSQEVSRILLIDSYDSFTYNLASLCRQAIPHCSIHIIRNDEIPLSEFTSILDHFSAVVVGPGPGSPDNDQDIGIVKHLWKLADEHLLPVFGVCLGLQSLGIEFGANLKRLNVVKHGQISRIEHDGTEIFKGVGEVEAVRYHSLHVVLDDSNKDVEALAWADDGEENGRIVMAAKHTSKPFWAVQYHPESVRTHGGGDEVLRNFWRLAKNWASMKGRTALPWTSKVESTAGRPWPMLALPRAAPKASRARLVDTRVLEIANISVTDICEALGVSDEATDFVLLDSAAQPGRLSIIGCLSASSPKISYRIGDQCVRIERNGASTPIDLGSEDIWSWLASFMRTKEARGGEKNVPFWGGFMGYLSYELGVASLATSVSPRQTEETRTRHPDVNFVFVERSIVMERAAGKVYVQTLLPDDTHWLESTATLLKRLPFSVHDEDGPAMCSRSKRRRIAPIAKTIVTLPDRDLYISRIKQAKEHLFAGESYELCLTAPTRISVPRSVSSGESKSSSWELYKTLRKRNPAPYSAYIRLHPSTLVSSSPERFLSFSRAPETVCQLRPIKGTVRKAPGVTRAVAEEALVGSIKEVAENLMIVDLIRHDLHGVVGEDVQVKQFCSVEEYETVWQLVSVIEGHPPEEHGHDFGWEVLRRSLPPGSMTGAPKKRSVEILSTLEDQERSIYSGVFGYWCVGGSGDWSVTIRSCFKHDTPSDGLSVVNGNNQSEDLTRKITDDWTLGAGGAITALSDPEAEWEEMVTKVESVVRAFDAAQLA